MNSIISLGLGLLIFVFVITVLEYNTHYNFWDYYKWYFKKLTFDQKALLDPNPGLLIFTSKGELYKDLYIDSKYIFNYLGITVRQGSVYTLRLSFFLSIKEYLIQIHQNKPWISPVGFIFDYRSAVKTKGELSGIYDFH